MTEVEDDEVWAAAGLPSCEFDPEGDLRLPVFHTMQEGTGVERAHARRVLTRLAVLTDRRI